METAGTAEAQAMSAARGEKGQGGKEGKAGKGEGKGMGKQGGGKGKGGQGSQGGKNAEGGGNTGASQGGFAPNPPKGLPIDRETWNRLPDDLRRDLLNAAGGRFPAEYEMSIRRYFKNLAENKEGER